MPYPFAYAEASQVFQDVLVDVRRETAVVTKNQAYTVLQGVLLVFRRRVDPQTSLRVADLLPVTVRALYASDWDLDEPRRSFADPLELAREVRSLRSRHNAAPDTCVADVVRALRRHVDLAKLDALLDSLPAEAAGFWRPDAGPDALASPS
ncbi:DUF2267 domain-containing protein [Jatrophihabitans fulvus]